MMPLRAFTKLNPVCSGLQRVVTGQGCNSVSAVSGHRKFLSYSSNILTNKTRFHTSHARSTQTMSASGSSALYGDIHIDDLAGSGGNGLDLIKPRGVYFAPRSPLSFQKASVSFRNREGVNRHLLCGFVTADAGKRNSRPAMLYGALLKKKNHMCSTACFSAGPNVSCEGTSQDVNLKESPSTSCQTLKLHSAACYLPHPDKEETGGEDAHFICVDEQAIGVADGVGGWADVGVNAGLYSRELMSHSVAAIQDEPTGFLNPSRVLEKAYSKTKAKGSSTACIIALTNEGLHAINLGDSGFVVIRDGSTLFHSPVQQHDFNFTYQLENSTQSDKPSSGQVFTIPVAKGDVIVAGTDGLFDNLYNNDVTAVVVQGVRSSLTPQALAQKIAALARLRALDKNHQSPFSSAAQEAGFRYYGGKLDDITVVVSYVTD